MPPKRQFGGVVLQEQTTPATPAAGEASLYPKAGRHLFILDSSGYERALSKGFGPNLLTPNQASLESGAVNGWNGNSCTLSAVTSQARHGAYSLQMQFTGTNAFVYVNSTIYVPVVAGKIYSGIGSYLGTVTSTYGASWGWDFVDAAFGLLTQVRATVPNIVNGAGWTDVAVYATAPATAVWALVYGVIAANTSGGTQQVFQDALGFYQGVTDTFVPPDQSFVQDEGTALAEAHKFINFTGAGVTATPDVANNRVNVAIPGGGAGGTTSFGTLMKFGSFGG